MEKYKKEIDSIIADLRLLESNQEVGYEVMKIRNKLEKFTVSQVSPLKVAGEMHDFLTKAVSRNKTIGLYSNRKDLTPREEFEESRRSSFTGTNEMRNLETREAQSD